GSADSESTKIEASTWKGLLPAYDKDPEMRATYAELPDGPSIVAAGARGYAKENYPRLLGDFFVREGSYQNGVVEVKEREVMQGQEQDHKQGQDQ
ncbi:hypothetical protein BGZ65_000454, partial [Modicella reniformis]